MTVLPSSFQLIESPAYHAHKLLHDPNKGLLLKSGCFLFEFVAVPIVIAATPITIVADIIIGVAETAFSIYQKGFTNEIKDILYKKVICAPIQQATFVFGAMGTALVIGAIAAIQLKYIVILPIEVNLPIILLMPYWTHIAGQKLVSLLPNSINFKQINIFVNNGIKIDGNLTFFEMELALDPSFNGDKIVLQITKEMLQKCKEGKIQGIDLEQFQSGDPDFFLNISRLIIFELISLCSKSNEDHSFSKLRANSISNTLTVLSHCSNEDIHSLIGIFKEFSQEEIIECKLVLAKLKQSQDVSPKVQNAFKAIGNIAIGCLRNPAFYNNLA